MPTSFSLASLLALTLLGCATRATPPTTITTPPYIAPARAELRPLNWSGDTTRQVAIPGGVVTVGLVDQPPQSLQECGAPRQAGTCDHPATVKVVRLDGRTQTELFVAPLQIAGVPPQLHNFDYQIDPTSNVDGATPNQFTLVASASESAQISFYATWVFTWNAARRTFDVGTPTVERRDTSVCLPCFS